MKIKNSKGEVITVPAEYEQQVRDNINNPDYVTALAEQFKKGGMLKRKDGSYSRRGLWDNIRANRGSGRKPTKQMLEQEAKIRAKEAAGGVVYKGYITDWTSGEPVPWHQSTIGETMGKGGYTVKKSSARKGKTHVVIGPDGTKKYFGDSKLGQHPRDPKRKKAFYARHAKNLKGNPYFRAFARATWADGGKLRLSDNMYENIGVMPYEDGGYTFLPKMNYDGTIHVPVGYGTPAYNERYGLGGDIGAGLTGIVGGALGTVPIVGGMLQQGVNKIDEAIQGPLTNEEKSIRGYGSAAGSIGAGLFTGNLPGAISGGASGIAEGISAGSPNSKTAQDIAQGLNIAGTLGGMAAGAGAFGNAGAKAAKSFGATGMGKTFTNLSKQGQFLNPLMGMMGGMGYGGYVRMADGGQAGMVPINVEGANFSQGSGPDAKKGELLVLNGKIVKNYVGRPPHPAEGQNPMGNDDAPEGLIVIPKARTKEYLEAGMEKRKQIERSLVSQQQDREMKKSNMMQKGGKTSKYSSSNWKAYNDPYTVIAVPDREGFPGDSVRIFPGQRSFGKTPYMRDLGNRIGVTEIPWDPYYQIPNSRTYQDSSYMYANPTYMPRRTKKGDGGYYSFGMGDQGMAYGGPIGNPETIRSMMDWGGPDAYKKGGWIQKATASIKRRGTEGVCTGSKFGSSSCPPGSRRYNLAKTFRKMAKARKHEHGGFVDPITGSHNVMYANGGQLPEGLLRARMRASGASPEEINSYVAAKYEMGGPTNVDRSAIYAGMRSRFNYGGRLRYDENVITGLTPAPGTLDYTSNQAGWSPYSYGYDPSTGAAQNDLSQIPMTYDMDPAQIGGGSSIPETNFNMGTPTQFDYANMGSDVASMLPALYNLRRGIFEKPVKMDASNYTTPEMQFRRTRFDQTPYDQAGSRAQYQLRQMGTGPGYKAAIGNIGAQMGQARSAAYMDWMNREALRRQGVDEANLGINARNKAMKLQIDMLNQQAKANRNKYFETASEQLAQTFGRDPMYFAAMAGQAPRQPFTGWRKP